MVDIMFEIAIIASLLFAAVLAGIVYIIGYRYRINRQLNDETYRPRRILSPFAFVIVTGFVVLLSIAVFLGILSLRSGGRERIDDKYINGVYSYRDYSPREMTGCRGVYSIESNPGYTKYVEQKGDMTFTIFMKDDDFDTYHPAFIVYAEYTGEKEILYYGIEGNFFTPADFHLGGRGHAGSGFDGYICVFGETSVEIRLELSVYLYDSALKGERMGDYAAETQTVYIDMPEPLK